MTALREPTYRERVLNYINERGEASGADLLQEFAVGVRRGATRLMFTLTGLELTEQIRSYNLGNKVVYKPIK